ncbi:MAG: zinc-binding dehydrogenase [Planctomycetales bacterium]
MTELAEIAVFTGAKRPFELREFPVPDPEPGAILVKIRMANVCGTDLHIWKGEYDISRGRPEPFSLCMGHEMAGEVARLGDGVTTDSLGRPLAVGDRIVYQYFCGCGRCPSCLRQKTPRCQQGLRYRYPATQWPHFNAAYGQYYYLHPEQKVFKVPENVSDDLAGPANCALAQVVYALERGNAQPGDSLVIQGAGGLGLNAVAVARERGVSNIIVIDALEERLELARQFGADHTLSLKEFPKAEDRLAEVRRLTEGWGADLVLEVAGTPRAFVEGVDLLGQGGTLLEVGNISQKQTVEFDPSTLLHGGKTILGIMWYEPSALGVALDLLSRKQGAYPFSKVLSHRFPLRRINEAFAEQNAGKIQRAALMPWE